MQQCMTNYEEALEKVKGMKYLTKPAFKEKEAQLAKLEATLGKVKKQLAKGDKGKVSITKDVLKEAVATISEAKENMAESLQKGCIFVKKKGNHLCKRMGPKKGFVWVWEIESTSAMYV